MLVETLVRSVAFHGPLENQLSGQNYKMARTSYLLTRRRASAAGAGIGHRLLALALVLSGSSAGMAQDVADRFNRANSNTVGGGWTETETAGAGASINGNELRLARTGSGSNRQYVSQSTPGTYRTTLNQNGCVLTWAFNMRQTFGNPSGFNTGSNGVAVVLAGSNATLTSGQGYAVVLGQSGGTDPVRLVRYNNGLDADGNLTNIVSGGSFGSEYLDVRVTYTPSTNTWALFYRNNGTGGGWLDPLTATTSAGSAVDATYTGTDLPFVGLFWNNDGSFGNYAHFDNFMVPSGAPEGLAISPATAAICSGGSGVDLTAAATSSAPVRVTFSGSGGPSTISTAGPTDGSIYPWNITVSGLPTSGVTVESVTLNGVTHAYPDDLDILLQSATGTNVILMSDVGGSTGITANTYTFMDGESAMADNAVNTTGIYAPTNVGTPDFWPTAPGPGSFSQTSPSLSLFTGNPNGTWRLLIRDDANTSGGSIGSWSITFSYTTPVTYTWSPATGLSGTTGATVTANPLSNQTYTVTAAHAANGCTAQATRAVTVTPAPTTATAGGPQTICSGGTTTGLGGNTPGVGSGSWSIVSGGTGTFSPNASAPNATFTHTGGAGPVVLRWSITNAPCTASTADVTVTIATMPAAPGAITGDAVVCQGASGLSYSVAPVSGVTTYTWSVPAGWSITSGQGTTDIEVSAGSGAGNITVVASNVCGSTNPGTTEDLVITPVAATHNTGYTTTTTKSSDGISCNSTAQRGYVKFPLSGLPAGAVVTAANLSLVNNGSSPSGTTNSVTALGNNDPVATGASALYNAIGSGAVYNSSIWNNTGVLSLNLNATGVNDINGRIGGPGWVAMGLLRGGTNTFIFHGFSGGSNAPKLTLTHTQPRKLAVTATPPPTTASVGGDQVICPSGTTAGLGGNTPAVGSGSWSIVSGGTGTFSPGAGAPNATFTHTGGAGPVVLRWSITNAPCAASTADVTVTLACAYYSRATGNVTDAIWSTTPSGPAGPATFTTATAMVVQSGHTVTCTSTTAVGELTVNSGGTLAIASTGSFSVHGTSAAINGTLTASDNSTFALAGSGAKTLTLASPTSFWDLAVNTPDGTTVTGTVEMRGTLLLQDGDFNCTGNPVIMRSTAAYTGRLGPVAATASYTGNMRMERYIPAGATNWRLIGSPIQNRRVVHLQDDFFTAGYPGSQYPNFFDPPGSGIFWPSIRWYDETNTGASINAGLQGVSSQNQNLVPGQGFAAWCGTGLSTTTAFTIDLENAPPVIASTPIALPMSWTSTGNPTVDGWNLVANPLPSPIAFDQIARGADVEDYVTFFDPATGNMATWDISLGAGTNGGTNTIQSMQAFYLKANGAALTTTVSESAKVSGNSGGFFGGSQQAPDLVRLRIASGMNTFSDETVVVFTVGEPAYTSNDVPKFNFSHPQAPRIGTTADGVNLAINAYGAFTDAIQIPVLLHIPATGTYTITATGIEQAGLTCIRLEDLLTGTFTTLEEGATYSFSATAGSDPNAPRFLIHASAPLPVVATDAQCHGQANGGVEVTLLDGQADVTIYNDMGQALQVFPAASGTIALGQLPMGDYEVAVQGYLGCANLLSGFRIEQPEAIAVQGSVADASCPASNDGQAQLAISGGVAPYGVLWSTGATTMTLVAGAGSYTALITDANGCTAQAGALVIGAGEGPTAQAGAAAFTVVTGQEVEFLNLSTGADSYAWDFGDGETSTDEAPVHAYALPGEYQVTLTATTGACSSTHVIVITVELTTGVADAAPVATMRAWLNGDHLVVEHGFGDKLPLTLELLNEAGQVWMQRRVAGQAGRMTVPAGDLASGIWYVRVSNSEASRTLPVVVVR